MDDVSGLRRVLQVRTADAIGLEYFHALAQSFAEVCDMRFGMFGRVVEGGDAIDTLAFWTGNSFGEPFRYELRGTPCSDIVTQRDVCQIGRDVAAKFPEDLFLQEQKIEAYVGVPLYRADGAVLGVLAALDARPRPRIEGLAGCVGPFAERAVWLLERLDLEDRLRREASRSAALAEVAGMLQRRGEAELPLDQVCEIVRGMLGVVAVSLRTVDFSGDVMVLVGGAGLTPAWGRVARLSRAMLEEMLPSGPVAEVRMPLLREIPGADALAPDIQCALIVRANAGERLVGTISVFHSDPDHAWAEDDVRWLIGVAGLVTQTLANTRLVEALRVSEARYREIVTTALEGIVTLDAAHRISFANPQAVALFAGEPPLGRALVECIHPTQRAEAAARFERLREGARHRFEVRLDGPEARWAVLSATPTHDAAGAYAGATVLLSEITEVRALAEQVAQLQKSESLGALAGGVAHDFNNLLGAMLGYLDLAQQKLPCDSPARAFLDEVADAGRRAAALTEQMLMYSGRSRPSASTLDLGGFVAELRSELADIARGHALRVSCGSGFVVSADAAQLRRVLHSLVANASEAIVGRAGTIEVAVSSRTIARADLGDHVLGDPGLAGPCAALTVSDDGCGIEAGVLPRIFDPFFSTKFTGRGLGLSAVLGVVRGHRGALVVDSRPGAGAAFTIFLPLAPGAAPPVAPSRPARILVVDDDPAILLISARVLESGGYDVVRALHGAAALSEFAAAGGEFAAVLLDMSMPVLDGARTFRALRQSRPDLPIIITSGHDRNEVLARLEGGVPAAFVPKPWAVEDLLGAVREAVGR